MSKTNTNISDSVLELLKFLKILYPNYLHLTTIRNRKITILMNIVYPNEIAS